MNIKDADFFSIQEKSIENKREGDYWVYLSTRGCGCCSDSDFDLRTKEEAKGLLKEWIEIKIKEVDELKLQLKSLEEKE
jgi:predicted RNase H-like HicB family nuclease